MTLSVSSYRRNEDGSKTKIPLQNEIAGVESTRRTFYGSVRSEELGLKLLPLLKDQAFLEVCGSELVALHSEVRILLESLPSGEEGEYWRFRLNNISAAIDAASAYDEAGCVSIG